MSDLHVLRVPSRLQQRLSHVQRRSHRARHGTRETARDDVRRGRVHARGVEEGFELLVHGELDGGEGDGHGEGGGVGDIEGVEAFCAVDGACAGEGGAEFGLVHLHSLFDHCRCE